MFLFICVYMVSFIVMVGISNLLLLLMMMESLSWAFTFLINSFEAFSYLLVQSYFLILGIVFSFAWISIVMVVFFFKMGMPPFHSWVIKIVTNMHNYSFMVFSTIHKLGPLLLLAKMVFSFSFNLFILSVVMVLSGILILQVSVLLTVLMFSSMIHGGWMLVGSMLSLWLMILYWSVYSFLVIMMTSSFLVLKSASVNQGLGFSLAWLILSGMPPLTMFWLKLILIVFMMSYSILLSVILLLVAIMSLMVYFRGFHLVISSSVSSNLSMNMPVIVLLSLLLTCF